MTSRGSMAAAGPAAPAPAGPPRRGRLTPLAWCGWRLWIPEDWRPLRLEGGWRSGSMMIGDASQAIAKVTWAHVRPDRARRWGLRRLGKGGRPGPLPGGSGGGLQRPLMGIPAVGAPFTECTLAESSKTSRAVWSGYAQPAGLLVEIVFNAQADERRRHQMRRVVLPSIAADPPRGEGWARWAIYGASFLVPPGFALAGRSLHLGEISLRFARRGERLSLGQVYPADLALSRRPLRFWLNAWPWRRQEIRRFRPAGPERQWWLPDGPARRAGLLLGGRKGLRWPLGFLAPRQVLSGAVVDESRGRILRAEIDSPQDPDESLLRQVLGGMDWAERPPRPGAPSMAVEGPLQEARP